MNRLLPQLLVGWVLLGGTWVRAAELGPQVVRGDRGMVVSQSPLASRVGRDVLAAGGNAVDAAVATAFALAVTWPAAGNIGGGGFMMVLPAPGQTPVCVEYRERAPLAAHTTMFDRDDGKHTLKIVGVPGTVRGLALAHRTYGRLDWQLLVAPAETLAERGFVVDQRLADSINSVLRDSAAQGSEFDPLRAAYGRADLRPWQPGDRIRLPDLARTLGDVRQDPDSFYQGRTAELLAQCMQRGGGLITKRDLAAYRARLRRPIHGTFRGLDVWGPPPPSSGGICLVEALNILENFGLRSRPPLSVRNVHLQAEVMKRVFCDRARHLGDPDFVAIPEHLTSKQYARQLAEGIDPQRAADPAALAPEIELAEEGESTTHFSVVDSSGMAVSNTYTLEASWGSRRVVPGAGFVLNNEMGDFNWLPGHTDRQGRIGTAANLIEPGKRMLSSQTPTIVTRQGRAVVLTGSPGGRTIINTVLNIVLQVAEYERNLAAAVAAPRMHHGWLPDVLYLEGAKQRPQLVQRLEALGHRVESRVQGSAHSIAVDSDGELTGVADLRRGGWAAALDSRTLARWDFDDPAGTRLPEVFGEGARWLGRLPGSEATGDGAYRIGRDEPRQPSSAYATLPEPDERPLWLVARLRAVRLGDGPPETLALGLTDQAGRPRVTARWTLRRTAEGQLRLRGEAPRGQPTPAAVLADSPQLTGPLTIALRFDPGQAQYQIHYWPAGQPPRQLGSARTARGRTARGLQLSAPSDFSAPAERVEFDSIQVTRRPPF